VLRDIDATDAGVVKVAKAPPAALSAWTHARGDDLAILLILLRRRNATKVSTLKGAF
jgi:hypothetical protein